MTAQVRLLVGNRQNVLRVPTAALRFRLSDEEIEKQKKQQAAAASASASASANASANAVAANDAPGDDDASFRSKADLARSFRIYTLDAKNEPKPLDVKIGLSNFRYTEVVGGELKKGDKVITRAIGNDQAGGM
jgi:HlyD family secretion protein